MSHARVAFDRKQVNRVLTRCKNGKHTAEKQRTKSRDDRRLNAS